MHKVFAQVQIVLAVALGGLGFAAACGSDAVGIEECRQIEQARCEAGQACGFVTDVSACKRFYRDHCLHGLTLNSEPGEQAVQRCVRSLHAAGTCAKANGRDVSLASCPEVAPATSTLNTACDAISSPEVLVECAFLVPKPAEADPGDASDSGDSDSNPLE